MIDRTSAPTTRNRWTLWSEVSTMPQSAAPTAATQETEVFCLPCDSDSALINVDSVRPFPLKYNYHLDLFICGDCNDPLCCALLQKRNTEKFYYALYRHFATLCKQHKGQYMAAPKPIEFSKHVQEIQQQVWPGAQERLADIINGLQQKQLNIGLPVEGLEIMRDIVRQCNMPGCTYSHHNHETLQKHYRGHDNRPFKTIRAHEMDKISTIVPAQRWKISNQDVFAPVIGVPAPPRPSASSCGHLSTTEQQRQSLQLAKEQLKQMNSKPNPVKRQKEMTKKDINNQERLRDWQNVLSLDMEQTELCLKTDLVSATHEAHDEAFVTTVKKIVHQTYKQGVERASAMGRHYRSQVVWKRDEIRCHQEESTDKKYADICCSLVLFVFLLCGVHSANVKAEQLAVHESHPGQDRLKAVGDWAIFPGNTSAPSQDRIYTATQQAKEAVMQASSRNKSLAGSRMDGKTPFDFLQEELDAIMDMIIALLCRQRVASEQDHEEPVLRFLVAYCTDEEQCCRQNSNIITHIIAALQYGMRVAFLNRKDFGDATTSEYDKTFTREVDRVLTTGKDS